MKQIRWFIISNFILIFSLLSSITFAVTINIPVDQLTIQAGIDAAQDGDIVLVDNGIYRGKGNVNIDFKGKSITVKSRNGAEVTIIDCEKNENTRGVIFQSEETDTSVLDGFTIKNGIHELGGGIYCNLASPTIKNCIITDNRATSTVVDEGGGGGIYFIHSSANVIDCEIRKNRADSERGAGILCSPRVLDTEDDFIIFDPVTIKNCNVSENTGIGIFSYRSAPNIQDCTVSRNFGRGILVDRISRGVMINNCRIEQNLGGIECIRDSSITINNSIIRKNSANIGGGILCSPSSEINVKGCIIVENNAAVDGGGIYVDSRQGSALIEYCTIANNFANERGGGIFSFTLTSIFILTDSIVWGNDSGVSQPQVHLAARGTIKSCNVQGGLKDIDRVVQENHLIYEDNIDKNPLFVDPENGNYQLLKNSPSAAMGAYASPDSLFSVSPLGKRIVRWSELKQKTAATRFNEK